MHWLRVNINTYMLHIHRYTLHRYICTQVYTYTGTIALVQVHIAQSIVKELSRVYVYASTFARSP